MSIEELSHFISNLKLSKEKEEIINNFKNNTIKINLIIL